jgi:hypothetical protein
LAGNQKKPPTYKIKLDSPAGMAIVEAEKKKNPPSTKGVKPMDLDEKLSCGLTRRQIIQMRRAGMEKPDFVSWAEWQGPKQLSHRHMLVAHLAALGYGTKDIARATNFTPVRVGQLLSTDIIKDAVRQIREIELQGLGIDQKINQLSSQAMRIYETALFDPGVKMRDKLRVADQVLDRKLGKPQQRVEIKTSLIGDFYQLLKQMDQKKVTDAVIEGEMGDPADALLPDEIHEGLEDTEPAPEPAPIEELMAPQESVSAQQAWIDANFSQEKPDVD